MVDILARNTITHCFNYRTLPKFLNLFCKMAMTSAPSCHTIIFIINISFLTVDFLLKIDIKEIGKVNTDSLAERIISANPDTPLFKKQS